MASIISGSMDVSKIDKERLNKGKYLNFTIHINDEVSNYGDSGYLTEGQTKEERENKKDKNFIGNVRVVWTNGNNVDVAPKKEQVGEPVKALDDDLPFQLADDNEGEGRRLPLISGAIMTIGGKGKFSEYVKGRQRKYKEKFSECGKFMKCLGCFDYKSLDSFTAKHSKCKQCNRAYQDKLRKKRNKPLW